MRFADFSARRDFADDFPRTNVSASMTFDLPEPFGPRTTLKSLLKRISVCRANDLNPFISSLIIRVTAIHPIHHKYPHCSMKTLPLSVRHFVVYSLINLWVIAVRIWSQSLLLFVAFFLRQSFRLFKSLY